MTVAAEVGSIHISSASASANTVNSLTIIMDNGTNLCMRTRVRRASSRARACGQYICLKICGAHARGQGRAPGFNFNESRRGTRPATTKQPGWRAPCQGTRDPRACASTVAGPKRRGGSFGPGHARPAGCRSFASFVRKQHTVPDASLLSFQAEISSLPAWLRALRCLTC